MHVLLFFCICEWLKWLCFVFIFVFALVMRMRVSVSVSKRGLSKRHKLNGCDPLVIWGSFSIHFLRHRHLLSYYITCHRIVLGLFIPKKVVLCLNCWFAQTILSLKALSNQMWKLYLLKSIGNENDILFYFTISKNYSFFL